MREKANNNRDSPHFLGRLSILDPPLLCVSPVNSLKIRKKTVKENGWITDFSKYFKIWASTVNSLFIINQGIYIFVKQNNNAITPPAMRPHAESNYIYAFLYSFEICHWNQVVNALNFCRIQILQVLQIRSFRGNKYTYAHCVFTCRRHVNIHSSMLMHICIFF